MNIEKNNLIRDFIFINLGCLINAIGVNLFLVNSRLLSGGVSGIALMIQYLTSIPAGYSTLLINIPLLIMCYLKLSRTFSYYTLVGTISCSATLVMTEFMQNYVISNNPLLLCVYGGVLEGIGIGIVFAYSGSTGGVDIISALIKKKNEDLNIGTLTFALNGIIVAVGGFLFGIETALYTLIMMYIMSNIIDKIITSVNRKKVLLIVTDHEAIVKKNILDKVNRGVTLIYGEGAYTGVKRNIIYTAVKTNEVRMIKNIVRNSDPGAFISVLDVSDVEGLGFKKDLPL